MLTILRMGVPGMRKLNTVYLYGTEVPMDEIIAANPKMFRSGVSLRVKHLPSESQTIQQ